MTNETIEQKTQPELLVDCGNSPHPIVYEIFARDDRIDSYINGSIGRKIWGTVRTIAEIDISDPYYFYEARGIVKKIWRGRE